MKKILLLLKDIFALNAITSIFDNDEHKIVSNRGTEILNKNNFFIQIKEISL